MEIAELFADAPKLGFIKRPDLKGRSMVDMTDQEGKDLAEFEDAATLESRRQLSEMRNKELYGFRRLVTTALEMFPPGKSDAADAELGPLGLPSKNWGPNSALEAVPVLMPDPMWFPAPEAMEALLESVMDSGDQRLRDFRMCGWWTTGVCDEHGERFRTHRTCKAGYDPRCPTKLTMKLRQLHLPDLDTRGEKYRMLHLTRWVPHGEGSKSLTMGRVHTEFVEAVARIAHRKIEYSGVDMMMRATAYQLGRVGFYVTYKLVLGELDVEKANETLLALTVALEAQVWGQRVTTRAEAAVVQMMEDSMYSFIGFVPGDNLTLNDQARLFIEYLAAVRHRHMAEPLSSTKFYWNPCSGTTSLRVATSATASSTGRSRSRSGSRITSALTRHRARLDQCRPRALSDGERAVPPWATSSHETTDRT